jgi:hypothetical protein
VQQHLPLRARTSHILSKKKGSYFALCVWR